MFHQSLYCNQVNQGMFYTVLHGIKAIYDHTGDTNKVWNDMSEYQKRNLGKLMSFAIQIGGAYAFYYLLSQGDDEEKSSQRLWLEHRILGAVKEQYIQVNPAQGFIDWKNSPNIFLLQAENAATAVAVSFALPIAVATGDEELMAAIDEWLHKFSKNTVGGPGYRDIRRFFADWIDKIIGLK